jgi:hypothetical protein
MAGTSVLPYRYRINGVLSTDKTVMQNMEMITSAAQSWLTYDINLGKWAVVINEPGNSIVSFNDSNIVGPISVQGTGLRDLYNTVRVEFPHVDLEDQPDYIEDTIPEIDRNANEPDNTLTINLDLVNDPVMAESLGIVELKQSRVDRVIKFTTDYTHLGVKAGDLIDVTNSVLNYTNKMFRVISMAEADAEDGGLNITITALEYDADVYNLDDIFRFERSNQNGLVTIGYVGAPTTPTIIAYANSARPRTSIATTVPTGIVDGIEFWFSSDGTNYVLLSTETPTGGAFTYGQTVTYDYDKYQVTSNVFAKCRAINATTTSDYSSVGSLLNFAPVQITDAIQDGTTALRSSGGGSLATALGIATLVQKVGNAFGSNSSAKLSEAVFSQAGFPNTKNIMVSDAAGLITVSGLSPQAASTDPALQMGGNVTFTASQNATYKVDCILDQNGSGARGGRGTLWSEDLDDVFVSFDLIDNVTSTVVATSGSGGPGAQYWSDFVITALLSLVQGRSYTLKFFYYAYTESNPTDVVSFDISYNVFTISP